jgi:hypothetical protein
MALRFSGVSMAPGKTTFAVKPASLFSSATVRTNIARAALNVMYASSRGCGQNAVRLPTATIRPFPDSRKCGTATRST